MINSSARGPEREEGTISDFPQAVWQGQPCFSHTGRAPKAKGRHRLCLRWVFKKDQLEDARTATHNASGRPTFTSQGFFTYRNWRGLLLERLRLFRLKRKFIRNIASWGFGLVKVGVGYDLDLSRLVLLACCFLGIGAVAFCKVCGKVRSSPTMPRSDGFPFCSPSPSSLRLKIPKKQDLSWVLE
ncbi:hypothetical protein ABW19_dt0210420 [Dactylella cylindrospora]|nr:hypothetical protein ABW19_dt0210420 [Dactylella cylindrospora]